MDQMQRVHMHHTTIDKVHPKNYYNTKDHQQLFDYNMLHLVQLQVEAQHIAHLPLAQQVREVE